MRRIQLTLAASVITLLLGFVLIPIRSVTAIAVLNGVCTGGAVNSSAVCQDKPGGNPLLGPGGLLTIAIQILTFIIGVAAVIVIIISGIRFVTSQGDPSTTNSARSGIIYALVGLVVAAVAQAMISFVLNHL